MIIEFTGAPGCGKSLISHELGRLIRLNGKTVSEEQYVLSHEQKQVRRIMTKITRVAKWCIFHPVSSIRALWIIRKPNIWMNFLYISGSVSKEDITIYEQGLCQCIGSLFDDREAQYCEVQRYLDLLLPKAADRIQVYVTVSGDKILLRAGTRADRPFYFGQHAPEKVLVNVIRTGDVLFDCWKQKYGEHTVIEVSNEADHNTASAAQFIYDAMKAKGYL